MSSAIPTTPSAWKHRVRMKNMQDTSIHKMRLRSASLITEEQFLALQVLWKYYTRKQKPDLKRFDLESWVSQAQEMLNDYDSWNAYIKNPATDAKDMPESTFVMARHWQIMAAETSSDQFNPGVAFSPKVTRSSMGKLPPIRYDPATPIKSPGAAPDLSSDPTYYQPEEDSPGSEELLDMLYTPTKDEEIVTAALSNLLSGLIVHTDIPNRWTVHRKSFKAQFSHAHFSARVDGYLEDTSRGEKVRALVEVKPVKRKKQIANICMQEAAEMVAWIKNDPDEAGYLNKPGRRLHVSQDRHEIYITFAEYDNEFIKYLNDENYPNPHPHFLTMHQYGPWRTNISSEMSDLGKYLLAINLRAQSDMEDERCEMEEDKFEENKIELDDDRMAIDPDRSENMEIGEDEDEDEDDEDEDDEDDDTDSNDELALDWENTRKSASVGRR